MVTKLKRKSFFMETHTTRSDIFFAERDQYVVLKPQCSKTHLDYFRIQIMLIATSMTIYLVEVL